jgi:vanillate O-demethylase monooxygenase subunit
MHDIPPAPTYARALGTNANIDRWQIIDFHPPSFVTVNAGVAPTGTGAPEGNRATALERFSMHSITPETETSTHYFWTSAFDPAAHDGATIAMLADQFRQAFTEDVTILERQQERRRDDMLLIDTNNDAGNLQVRRILERLAGHEAAAPAARRAAG